MTRIWRPLFGAQPQLSNILIAAAAAVIIAAAVLIEGVTYGYAIRHNIILAILAIDISAGVVTSVTSSTAGWYKRQPRSVSFAFLLLHALHPLLFYRFLGLTPSAALFLFIAGAGLAAVVMTQRAHRFQIPLAFALTAATVVLYGLLFLPPPPIAPLGTLYLIKLIAAFAPNYSTDR